MDVSGDSKALSLLYLLLSLLSLAVGIVLCSYQGAVDRYVAAAACFVLFLASFIRFLGAFVPKLMAIRGLIFHIALYCFLYLCLGIIGYGYGEPYSFYLGLAIFVICYGVVIPFFKENAWKDDGATKSWRAIRNAGMALLLLFIVICCSILSYDTGFQGAATLLFIPVAAATLIYFLNDWPKGKNIAYRVSIGYLLPVLLGLCPIVFLFL